MTQLPNQEQNQINNNLASRIIDVIDARIKRKTRSMAMVETTWGEVAARDTGANTVDVYLYGSAYSSPGFRVIAGGPPLVGARVRVAIDKERGDRWVMEPITSGSGTTIGGTVGAMEDGSTVVAAPTSIDFRHGLDVTSSGTTARVAVDETELSIPEASLSIADNTTGNVTSTAHGFAPKSPADATKFLNGATTPAWAQVKDSDLSTTDITTNNSSSTKHGFAPKSPADATQFLNGATTPAYAQVKDSDLSTSDITTNNATTSKHGFLPKLPNDAAKFLDGTGAFTTISVGHMALTNEGTQDEIKVHGSMGTTETFDPTDGNVHTGTLDNNCTFTINAPIGTGAATLELWITQDGTGGHTITWPGSVTSNGTLTPSTAAGVTVRYILESVDGGTSWILDLVGGASVATVTTKDEGSTLSSTVTTFDFTGGGVTASGSGATTTVNIPTPAITTKDEGSTLSSTVTTLNFTGAGVTASGSGATTTIDIPGGGSGGTITTEDEGSTLSSTVTTLNFTGAGVTASGSGATTTINIPGGGGTTSAAMNVYAFLNFR